MLESHLSFPLEDTTFKQRQLYSFTARADPAGRLGGGGGNRSELTKPTKPLAVLHSSLIVLGGGMTRLPPPLDPPLLHGGNVDKRTLGRAGETRRRLKPAGTAADRLTRRQIAGEERSSAPGNGRRSGPERRRWRGGGRREGTVEWCERCQYAGLESDGGEGEDGEKGVRDG